MIISIIVAVAKNMAIGKNNSLLCHIPGDLKRFKALTVGHTVIMGRMTFLSLPNGPLPDRRNIVLTSHPEDLPKNCESARSLDEALNMVKNEDEVFIMGGGKVYKSAYNNANRLYITFIDAELDGDTFFPEIDKKNWIETFREDHKAGEKCKYDFSFIDLKKK